MVFPGPHPEVYRSLSLAISLIGPSCPVILILIHYHPPPPARLHPTPPCRFRKEIDRVFLGVSVLSFCIARRPAGFRFHGQFASVRFRPTQPDTPVFAASLSQRFFAALLIDSWIFIFSSAVVTLGIGLSLNFTICNAAKNLCGAFYALSKFLIYMFLGQSPVFLLVPDRPTQFNLLNYTAERVYTVHGGAKRLKSTAYRICGFFFLVGLGVLASVGIWGRIAFLRDGTTHTFALTEHIMDGTDNACVIGVVSPAYVLQPLNE